MPLLINENGSSWRTDFSTDELLAAIRQHELPQCLEDTVVGNVPGPLQYWCERVTNNGVWPLQDDFIPVWTTNGTSCLAYEPSINKFTYQHIEDVPEGAHNTFDSFAHVSVWVLLDLIGSKGEDEIRLAAKFLGFDKVDELLACSSVEEFHAKVQLDP